MTPVGATALLVAVGRRPSREPRAVPGLVEDGFGRVSHGGRFVATARSGCSTGACFLLIRRPHTPWDADVFSRETSASVFHEIAPAPR